MDRCLFVNVNCKCVSNVKEILKMKPTKLAYLILINSEDFQG